MAENLRGSVTDDDESHLDLGPLLRLGGWGGCAIIALAVAVSAGRTDFGDQRASIAYAAITGTQQQQTLRAAGAEMLARADAEREVRRTAEAVRLLAAERDRLSQRIATVERNLDDLTGSIKRQREAPPAPPDTHPPVVTPPAWAMLPPAPAAAPATVAPPTTAPRNDDSAPRPVAAPIETTPLTEPPPKEAASKEPAVPAGSTGSAGAPPAKPSPRPATMALIQSYATSSAAADPEPPAAAPAAPAAASPAAVAAPTAAAAAASGSEFAVDLGASASLNGIRALWERTRARQPAQLGNLRPLVSIRDGTRPGSTELRLVAGPIANAVAAARLCAALVAAGVACQPAMFDGQRLALR
jgi:hypothetical protein